MSKKMVSQELTNLTAPAEGKKRKKKLNPALVSENARAAIVQTYTSKRKRKLSDSEEGLDLSTKKGVATYYGIREDDVTAVLDYVVSHPFTGKIKDVYNIIRTSANNERQHYPVAPKEPKETTEKSRKRTPTPNDGLTGSQRRSLNLLRERAQNLVDNQFANKDKVHLAIKDYLRGKYPSFQATARANGWSEQEFMQLTEFGCCVLLSERRLMMVLSKMFDEVDYINFIRLYDHVMTFRATNKETFEQLNVLYEQKAAPEDLENIYSKLYTRYTSPDAFVPKEEAPAENADTAEG